MKKWISFIFIMLLLLVGCSEKSSDEGRKKDAELSIKVEEEEQAMENEEQAQLPPQLDQIVIPETIQDLVNSKSGIFVEHYQNDTNGFATLNPLEGIQDQWIEAGKNMPASTDNETWMKALVYYLGNNAYGKVVGELAEIEPLLPEPFLPEAKDITLEGEKENSIPEKAIILLDASSSMLLDVENKQKMKTAKEAVLSFGKTIGANSELSLYIYGHAGTQSDADKALSCSQIDQIYQKTNFDEESFVKAVSQVEAKGWTPLAEAIKTAHIDNEDYEGSLTLYIVSDGKETCDGDPVAEAKDFADKSEKRHVNIIGFHVDRESENQLKEVAEAGNGEYLKADNAEELRGSITQKWVPSDMEILMKQAMASPKNSISVSFQKLNVDQLAMLFSNAIVRENARFRKAIDDLQKEEIITAEQGEELRKEVGNYSERLKELKDRLSQEKKQSIEAEVERIDNKIQDWVKRMEKLEE